MGIHDVVNADLLKHYHESTLETDVQPTHPVDVVPDSQLPLSADRVFDTKTRRTRQGSTTSYLVAKQAQLPHQARWISHHRMVQDFASLSKALESNASIVGRNDRELDIIEFLKYLDIEILDVINLRIM